MSQKGKLFINGKCARETYGAYLGEGSLSALMTPPPIKPIITNNNRVNHGAEVVVVNSKGESLLRYDTQDITLFINITADSYEFLKLAQDKLFKEIMSGMVQLSVPELPGVIFRLVYQSSSQYSQFNGQLAKFSVKFIEPNPNNRNT